MPKPLNVAKLEKKFATLTKSRDSIQNLSHWIIQHKQYYFEIVQEWFNVLKKCDEQNIITVFYVANDVIQNCGKKGAPEYRNAFSPILEQAVALENVKTIKDDVLRMISLWCDRGIYSTDFFQQLKSTLEQNVSNSEDNSEDSEDLSDSEIITNYKLQDLVDSLRKMTAVQKRLNEKESLMLSLEPEEPNFDNLIVRMDGHQLYKRFEVYQDSIEEYLKLAQKAMSTKKRALKYLNYSNTYYCVQNSEVKKVAQAYKLYGKKLKSMDEKLLVKKKELKCDEPSLDGSNSSPVLECELASSKSSISGISPVDLEENSNTSATTSKIFLSPVTETSNQSLIASSEADNTSPVILSQSGKGNISHSEGESILCDNKNESVQATPPIGSKTADDNMPESSRSPEVGNDLLKSTTEVKMEHNPTPAPEKPHADLTIKAPSPRKPDSLEDYLDEVDSLLEAGFTNKSVKRNVGMKRKIDCMFEAEAQKSKKKTSDTTGSEVEEKLSVPNSDVQPIEMAEFVDHKDLPIVNTQSDDKVKGENNAEESVIDLNNDIIQSSQIVQSAAETFFDDKNCLKSAEIPGIHDNDEPTKTVSIPGLDDINMNMLEQILENENIKSTVQDCRERKSEIALKEPEMQHHMEDNNETSVTVGNPEVMLSTSNKIIINGDVSTSDTVINCSNVPINGISNSDNVSDLNTESVCRDVSTPNNASVECPLTDKNGSGTANANDIKDSASQSSVHANHSNLLKNLKALSEHLSKPKFSSCNSKVENPESDLRSSIPVMPLNSLFAVLSCVLSSTASLGSDSKLKDLVEKDDTTEPTSSLLQSNLTESGAMDSKMCTPDAYFNADIASHLQQVTRPVPAENLNVKQSDKVFNSQGVKEESCDVNKDLGCNLEVTDMDVDSND